MKPRARRVLLLTASLVVALSFVVGAFAPPLHLAAAPAAPTLTAEQRAGVQAAVELLLSESEDETLYLPLIRQP